jgi:hypothetical protein
MRPILPRYNSSMSEEINVQIALIDILQNEMQTAWEKVRSYLEHGEIEQAWESLNGYFDATHSIFSEQEELRVLIRKHKVRRRGTEEPAD